MRKRDLVICCDFGLNLIVYDMKGSKSCQVSTEFLCTLCLEDMRRNVHLVKRVDERRRL